MRTRTLTGLVLVALSATSALATTHTVSQSGLTFSPAALTVTVGDTVVWNWSTGSHTVTNGAGTSDPEVAQMFDAPLTSANPTFSFVFDATGEVPYFCRPHLNFGMTGTITVVAASGVEQVPSGYPVALLQNTPNPFNPQTTISFRLTTASSVNLDIVDLSGHRIRTLVAGQRRDAGLHRAVWNGRDDAGRRVATGIYLYVLDAGEQRVARSMALVK